MSALAVAALNFLPLALLASIIKVLFRVEDARPPFEPVPASLLDLHAWVRFGTYVFDGLVRDWGQMKFVIIAGLCYAVTIIATKAIEVGLAHMLWRMRCGIYRDLGNSVFHHISNLSLDFFFRKRSTDLASRIINDVLALATEYFEFFTCIFSSLPMAIVFWAILFAISPLLTGIMVALVGVSLLVARGVAKSTRNALAALTAAQSDSGARLTEVLGQMHLVKAFAAEDFERDAYANLTMTNLRFAVWAGGLKRSHSLIQSAIQSIAQVLLLVIGVAFVLSQRMSVEALLLYLITLNKVQGPTRALVDLVQRIQSAAVYAGRIGEILAERSSVPDGEVQIESFSDSIVFDKVSFAYGNDAPVLNDVSLTIRKGETLAIVGASGSGKSTLINLVLRFYDPSRGRVLVDGLDVTSLHQASYRRLFGVVTQDPMLFNDTVRHNIAYAAPIENVAKESVARAARIALAHDFISELPQGYDTVIGDRGVRLSGGQKQRLTLARAILRDPAILILDEGTSALDSETERSIQNAIAEYLRGRTAIIVAHRLSTIRDVDRIVVLSGGTVVEEGRHHELLARGGAYRRLWDMQTGVDLPAEAAS
jgi:subfamily B ATP-binding cassette protein MsbA